ncbi:MAG: hypothetical protein CMM50_16585 [Rhodospirillaceae bacterium]|nr:hypothetical protein [Rhodospirillaceae bacterium]|tara:strand:+ start:151 stop:390 length:240 start_codon:yes stop_codon:yes gene_type:complete
MAHTPHELAEEFPDHKDKLHTLKTADPHFARLADEYHEVNRTIHRSETGVEPLADLTEEEFRKRRLHLKDEIAAILQRS